MSNIASSLPVLGQDAKPPSISRPIANFHPTIWGDYFLSYAPSSESSPLHISNGGNYDDHKNFMGVDSAAAERREKGKTKYSAADLNLNFEWEKWGNKKRKEEREGQLLNTKNSRGEEAAGQGVKSAWKRLGISPPWCSHTNVINEALFPRNPTLPMSINVTSHQPSSSQPPFNPTLLKTISLTMHTPTKASSSPPTWTITTPIDPTS
ncbi:hypothetical protein Fmac_021335 [Flemingia macrophylla]|uniref:Uncharacterized protein n=1 Tax=Flemingia macrophylla TaxID=520843 RepID=A0ABD1LWL1_9FABA